MELIFSQPFYTILSDFFDLAWIGVFIYSIDPISLIIFISVTPLIIISSKVVGAKQRSLFAHIQELESDKIERAENSFQGIDSIKILQTEPHIYINGNKYDTSGMFSLRSHFTYVSQDPLIIPASLKENIYYGAECHNDGAVKKVIKQLNLSHLIDRNKLEPRSLSGEERKRIAMARTLTSNGNIKILDEVNSNLDQQSRRILEKLISISFRDIIHSSYYDCTTIHLKISKIYTDNCKNGFTQWLERFYQTGTIGIGKDGPGNPLMVQINRHFGL